MRIVTLTLVVMLAVIGISLLPSRNRVVRQDNGVASTSPFKTAYFQNEAVGFPKLTRSTDGVGSVINMIVPVGECETCDQVGVTCEQASMPMTDACVAGGASPAACWEDAKTWINMCMKASGCKPIYD